jgi:hypothetical protein
MKRGLFVLFIVLFFASFCLAVPEISLQKENYQASETIVGTISGVYGEITVDKIKVYDGRREVFFEKDLAKINDSYYFYIIPQREGNFSLKIENLLYQNNNTVASTTLLKYFNTSNKVRSNNKTQILTIRPGFYVGDNPEIEFVNAGNDVLNFSVGKTGVNLTPENSQKVRVSVPSGFSFLEVKSYETFRVPILNLGNATATINDSDNIPAYDLNNSYIGCLVTYRNMSVNHIAGNSENYSLEINNSCNYSLDNIELIPTERIVLGDNNVSFEPNEMKSINFTVDTIESGAIISNISFFKENVQLAMKEIIVFSFKNESGLVVFNQARNATERLSCEERNGTFCTQMQSCSTDNYDFYVENSPLITCCLDPCIDSTPPTNWSNVFIGIFVFAIIVVVLYVLYNRSKKVKSTNPQDTFKELDKRYQKGVVGNNKK